MYLGTKVLDVNGHVSVPEASNLFGTELMSSHVAMRSPLLMGGGTVSEDEYRTAAARHIAYLDSSEIDVQLIGPRHLSAFGRMAPELLACWAEHVNLTIEQQVRFCPSRLLGACYLPQNAQADDLTHVLGELERCIDEFGMVAAYASPDPEGNRSTPAMDEPYWYPLYESCEERGVPIILNEMRATEIGAGAGAGLRAVGPGSLFEPYLASRVLVRGDVFEHFPELKIVVCDTSGALDPLANSNDEAAEYDLSDNLFFATCVREVESLGTAIRQWTVERTVLGTASPLLDEGAARDASAGPSGDGLVAMISGLAWLSESEKIDIFNRNPARVIPALGRV